MRVPDKVKSEIAFWSCVASLVGLSVGIWVAADHTRMTEEAWRRESLRAIRDLTEALLRADRGGREGERQ